MFTAYHYDIQKGLRRIWNKDHYFRATWFREGDKVENPRGITGSTSYNHRGYA
jgi:hypothetical protein